MLELPSVPGRFVEFERFRFDLDTARLFDAGALVAVPPKAVETLRVLLQHRSRIVTKDELLALVWPDTIVEEANLAQQIFVLRRVLGDEAERPRFIATLPRRGYRFVADVIEISEGSGTDVLTHPSGAVAHDALDRNLEATTEAGRTRPGPGWPRARALAMFVFVPVLVLVLTAAVSFWGQLTTQRPAAERTVGFDLEVSSDVVVMPDSGLGGVSPDGRLLAFVARRQGGAPMIWIRALDGQESHPLSGSERASRPFWSPDSRELAFFADSKLRVITIAGGPPRELCDTGAGVGGSWGRDNTILFAAGTRTGIFRISPVRGSAEAVTTLDGSRRDVSHRYPHFLPDGKHFLFLVWSGDTERQGIYVGTLDGAPPRRLLADTSPAVWSAGSIMFVRREMLVAQEMNPQTLALSGEPQLVAESVGRDPSDAAAFAASASGDLVVGRGRFQTRLVWFDRSGRTLYDFGPPAHWADPAISRDGTRAAFVFRDRSRGNENLDLWIDAGPQHVRSRVTFDPSIDVLPVWSPDGRDLVFRSNRSGYSDLYQKRVDASTPEALIFASKTRKDPTDWSADGASILFTDYPSPGHQDIWLLPLASAAAPRLVVKGRAIATNARFSPDGRYIAYESSEAGDLDVYVQSLNDVRRWRVSTNGGTEPAWGQDGRELFFISHERQVNAVTVSSNPDGLTFGTLRTLFEVPITAWLRNGMAVSPDGQRFLVSVDDSVRPTRLNVVLNWHRSR